MMDDSVQKEADVANNVGLFICQNYEADSASVGFFLTVLARLGFAFSFVGLSAG